MPDLRRLQRDLEEAMDYPNTKITFPDEGDTTVFIVHIYVLEGLFRNHWYPFKFTILDAYPNEAPNVQIQVHIWHPNINEYDPNGTGLENGKVCVASITSHYLPTMVLTTLIEAVKYLLHEENFNPHDSRNKIAGTEYLKNRDVFIRKCKDMINEMKDDDESDDEK